MLSASAAQLLTRRASAYGGLAAAETVAMRQTAMKAPLNYGVPKEMPITMEQEGRYDMLIYYMTDCHDLVNLMVATEAQHRIDLSG